MDQTDNLLVYCICLFPWLGLLSEYFYRNLGLLSEYFYRNLY